MCRLKISLTSFSRVESNTIRLSFKKPLSSSSERRSLTFFKASSFVDRSFASRYKRIFRCIFYLAAAVIPSLAFGIKRKSAGICICCRPTVLGFSHCPVKVGRQPQKPTPVYAINAFGYISPEIPCQKQDNHISTGIYRCSTLDFDKNFARI